jgi:hypothetical protein
MSVTKAKFGKPVPLLVDAKGFPDGRAVFFEIWKESGGKKDKIDEITGVVRREKGTGNWEPKIKREESLPLQDKLNMQPQKVKYTFIAIIDKDSKDEKKTQGTPIEFSYPLEISLVNLSGKSLKDIKFRITFTSDGSSKEGILKNGYVKIDDAPSGKFTVKLEGYDFVFK